MFTDPDYRTFFVEEKASGYSSRNAELFGTWDSGGGRYQTAAYMPAATLLTRASFHLFGVGSWQLRLPFVLSGIVCLLCFGITLVKCYGMRLGLLAIATFGASPLLISLNSTAVNENLYLAFLAIILLLLTKLESSNIANIKTIAVLLGLVSSMAIMIKIEGFIIVLSTLAVLGLGHSLQNIRKRILFYYLLGCVIGIGMLLLYIISIPGIEGTLDFYRWMHEIMVTKYKKVDLYLILDRLYLFIPKNLQSFLPGYLFLGIVGILMLPFNWRKQGLPIQFSLFMVLLICPLLVNAPLLYWKRFVLVLVPFFFIGVNLLHQLRTPHPGLSHRFRLAIIVAIATVISIISAFSTFNGHWKLVVPWTNQEKEAIYYIIAIFLAPLIAAGLIVIWRKPEKLIYTCGIIVSFIIVISGIFFCANHHWRFESDRIGKSIASLVDDTVVADEQAFRYFGYYSNTNVLIMHENDPKFPYGVLELARTQKPNYIIGCDAYRPIPDIINDTMLEYEPIVSYKYSQPRFFFSTNHKAHTITLFNRNEKTVYIPVFTPDTEIEAEDAYLRGKNLDILTDIPDTSGKYVINGNFFIKLNILEDSVYKIKVRVIAKDSYTDSFYLRIGNGEKQTWHVPHCSKWEWKEAPFEWFLRKGEHLLEITNREPTPLDQIVITKKRK